MHTLGYRHSIVTDVDNVFDQGVGAIIGQSGTDGSMVNYIAPSILDFLEVHLARLRYNYFYTERGFVESYCNYP